MADKKERKSGIDDTIKRLDAYNKEHGTSYFYGKFKMLERMEKIKA